jgi:hypothetical protein
MNGGCSGEQLDTLREDGMFPFQRGMEWCHDMSNRFDEKDLCCRCDRGDGIEMTEKCWLQRGGMEPDKDFAFMVRGDPGMPMDGGRGRGRGSQNPEEMFMKYDMNGDGFMSMDEFMMGSRSEGAPMPDDILMDIFNRNMDDPTLIGLNMDQFRNAMRDFEDPDMQAQMMWRMMDQDGDGLASFDDFIRVG